MNHQNEEQALTVNGQGASDLLTGENFTEVDVAGILSEYHRRLLLENLIGPSISLTLHVILLTLMFVLVTTRRGVTAPTIEVAVVEEQIVEVEKEVLEEIVPPEPTIEDRLPSPDPSDAVSEDVGVNTSIADFTDDQAETADSMDTKSVMDVVNNFSPLQLQGIYGGRTNSGRKKAEKKYGASGGGVNAVNKALMWLARVQNADGSWGNQSPAHTGMALLTFLAHGETPLSEQYGNTVQKAMKWLVDKVMVSPDGYLGQQAYGHGIATYALCESYGMTRIPFVRAAAERALYVIVKGQQDGGGFNYDYTKVARWDLSVTGWQAQALKAGYVAGCSVGGLEDAIRKCITFIRRTTYANYKFGYSMNPGSGGNMTGIGTVGLQLLGAGASAEAGGGVRTIATERLALYQQVLNNPAAWDGVMGPNLYGFYYDTQAIFNSQFGAGGNATWKEWRNCFEKVLIRAQQPEGYWEVASGWALGKDLPGRIFATTQACLQLEVYYRYLPTYDPSKMEQYKVNEAAALSPEDVGGRNDPNAPLRVP